LVREARPADREREMSDQAHYRRGGRVMDLALLLLQQGTTGNPAPIGVFRFFAGFVLIVTIYSTFLGFTYWISKDE
jgi:hypothetical protein